LDVIVSDKEGLIKEIKIKVSFKEIEPEFERYYEEEGKKVKIDGFRKGKVPKAMVKKMFGKQIEAGALNDLVNKYYVEAIVKEKLNILVEDGITLEKFSHETGLEFTAKVEVKPEIEIPDIEGRKIKKEIYKVKDDEVDNVLIRIQYNLAKREKSDGPAEEGDFVLMNIQEIDPMTKLPMVGRKWGDRYIRVGENEIGPEFDEAVKGAKTGEIKQVNRSGASAMISQVQEGQTDEAFNLEIKGIDKVELAPLDDEFAKSYNKELKTLEELKNNIEEELKVSKSRQADMNLEDSILKELRDSVKIETPELFVK
jgi:trigger factor